MSDIKTKKKKERKKGRKKQRKSVGLHYDKLFYFLSHDSWSKTVTRYKSYKQHKGDMMEMKSKLYLQIIL